ASAAEKGGGNSNGGSLLEIASKLFPGLTRAERALLEFADVKNVGRGDYAVVGASHNPDDPSNDPAHAGGWNKEREIRALLLRWLCEDPAAIKVMSPSGIAVLG